ncbi:MAG: AAC(3) family N-acetyltransferase [Verrucomicrobiaceae bacterium]|nr:AAC(3) family N-acetyltransferase [Verrucomicrobiaceae bacterium]
MLRSVKKRIKLLIRALTRPWVTRRSLARSLRAAGVREGGALLVHSSLSSLGFVPGGAAAVIAALHDAVGPRGTLLMPAHTWEWMNKGCRVFDARTLPGCVGALAEAFRLMPGTVRSLHPTHSVCAAGPDAVRLTAGHEQALTPCGAGTPYARLLEEDGQILFLGASLDSNTAFHTMESLCGFPHLLRPGAESFEIIAQDGTRQARAFRQHLEGIARRYAGTEQELVDAGVARTATAGGAKLILLGGAALAAWTRRLLENDPLALMADRHQDMAALTAKSS